MEEKKGGGGGHKTGAALGSICPTRNAAVSSRLSSHSRSSPARLVYLSATNHKSNIDKLGRSESHHETQQLILKVLFLPLVGRGMGGVYTDLCQRGRLPPLLVVGVQEQLV